MKRFWTMAIVGLTSVSAQAAEPARPPVEPGFVTPVGPEMLVAADGNGVLWSRNVAKNAAWARVALMPDSQPYVMSQMRCAENNGGVCVVQFTANGQKETRIILVKDSPPPPTLVKGGDEASWTVEAMPDGGHIYFTRPAAAGNGRTVLLYTVFDQNYTRIDRVSEVGKLGADETLMLAPVGQGRRLLAVRAGGQMRDLGDDKVPVFQWHFSDFAAASDWGVLDAEPWATDAPAIANARSLHLIQLVSGPASAIDVKAMVVTAIPQDGEIVVPQTLTVDGLNDVLAVTVGPKSKSLSLLCKADTGEFIFKPLVRLDAGATPAIIGSKSGAGFVISTPSLDHSPQYDLIRPSTNGFGWANRNCTQTRFTKDDAGVATSNTADSFAASRHETASADGTRVPYDLVTPKAGPRNAIITLYGAYGLQYRQAFFKSRAAAYLGGNGTAAVFPIVRGDGNLGLDYALASRTPNRQRAVADVVAVAEDLIRQYPNLKGRIALKGTSAGAWLSVKTALSRPDLFSGVIAISGPYLFKGAPYSEGGTAFFGAGDDLTGDLPLLKAACSALKFRFIHARDDLRVAYDQAERFAGLVKAAGCPVELISHDTGGHSILLPVSDDAAYQEALRANLAPF